MELICAFQASTQSLYSKMTPPLGDTSKTPVYESPRFLLYIVPSPSLFLCRHFFHLPPFRFAFADGLGEDLSKPLFKVINEDLGNVGFSFKKKRMIKSVPGLEFVVYPNGDGRVESGE